MIGAVGTVKWDFMPAEGATSKANQLLALFTKFARECYALKPPFIPTLEGQTFEQFKHALSNPASKNFLKKISSQWRQGLIKK